VPRYAVIVSRFPKFTETFILQELRGMEARGLDFELYSIIHETPEQMQPDAVALDDRANYLSWRSREVAAAQLHWLRRSPLNYLRTWWLALRTSFPSRDALVRAPMLVLLAAAMARRMESQGVERVHSHWATYPTMCALCIRQLCGIPFSFTGHAHDIFSDRVGLATKVERADAVLTCTDHGRSILVDEGGGEAAAGSRVHLVHHGVRLDVFAQQPLAQRESGDPLRILCVAALQEYKGHRYLLDACAELTRRGVPNRLTLLGDGELREELEAQAVRLGLDVRFLGRRPSAEVRDELAGTDVFALASVQMDDGNMDGIPNVAVEAMAIGRPVVMSSLPGIRELVVHEETGLLAASRDSTSLADQLERIANDRPLVEALVAKSRGRVELEHDAERNLDEVRRILESLPARRPGSAGTSA
jgi:glycosyltransferase involved in cell wall biosynthesis